MKTIKSILLFVLVIQISGCEDKEQSRRIAMLEKKLECQQLESTISNTRIELNLSSEKLDELKKKGCDLSITEKELQEGKRLKEEVRKLTESIEKSKAEFQQLSCSGSPKESPAATTQPVG